MDSFQTFFTTPSFLVKCKKLENWKFDEFSWLSSVVMLEGDICSKVVYYKRFSTSHDFVEIQAFSLSKKTSARKRMSKAKSNFYELGYKPEIHERSQETKIVTQNNTISNVVIWYLI